MIQSVAPSPFATERLLDELGVRLGWSCLDVWSGDLGPLPALVHRVGPVGRVTGLPVDQLPQAPEAAFDLVYARLLPEAPPGADRIVAGLRRAAAPGGLVVVVEPNESPDSRPALIARLYAAGLRDLRVVETPVVVTGSGRKP